MNKRMKKKRWLEIKLAGRGIVEEWYYKPSSRGILFFLI